MDCKPEPRARTFVRIAILCLEGVLTWVISGIIAAIVSPVTAAVFCYRHIKYSKGWRKVVLIPAYIVHSIIAAIAMPFVVVAHHIASTIEIVKIEWMTRWMAAQPKTPNGHPIAIGEGKGDSA